MFLRVGYFTRTMLIFVCEAKKSLFVVAKYGIAFLLALKPVLCIASTFNFIGKINECVCLLFLYQTGYCNLKLKSEVIRLIIICSGLIFVPRG